MLAVIRALEDWCHFLEGAHHKFEIWTDHKNLEYFMTVKKLNHCQAWWSLYLCPGSTSPCIIDWDILWASTMLCPAERTMVPDQGTTTMSHCSVQSTLQFTQSEPFPDCHWKERSATSFGIFTRETMRASKRMLLRILHQNSGDPRENLSEHRSGQSMMGSSVSGTKSMCQMTQSYVAASHCSTMTPE